jgi:hypothetical protein
MTVDGYAPKRCGRADGHAPIRRLDLTECNELAAICSKMEHFRCLALARLVDGTLMG